MEKIENCKICVKRLEGDNDYLKVVFDFPYGEYYILTKKEYIHLFSPGIEYEGVFKISGIPDFIGDEDKWENVCTVSHRLEKIVGENVSFEEGEIVYEII